MTAGGRPVRDGPRICARPSCGAIVRGQKHTRRYCSVACGQWGRQQTRQRYQTNSGIKWTAEYGPPIGPALDRPTCGCGRRMDATTDFLGRTVLQCEPCQVSCPVRIVGQHKYDQRERHEPELDQLVTRGKTRVRKINPVCGDAFRQASHKRG